MKVYFAKKLYDGKGNLLENVYIGVSDNEISYVGTKKPEGDLVGEFPYATPAFIDAHAHIGLDREGEPYTEGETNDYADSIQPVLNPLDSVYFDDTAFKNSVENGVLYSCIVPGSGNLLGGKAVVIRNFARNRKEAFFRDYGYKMALGYNPRSVYGQWGGKRFNTRMGANSHLEFKLDEVKRKARKQEIEFQKGVKDLEKSLKKGDITQEEFEERKALLKEGLEVDLSPIERSIMELLRGEKIGKVHVHKADDVLYLIELKKKYGLKVTADHTADVFEKEIFVELKNEGIPVVYGPISSFNYKVELKNSSYKNVKPLIESGVFYGLMTDHPVVLQYLLFYELRYFLLYGITPEKAIEIITMRNAKILGIDDVLGSVEKGKLASFVLWNGNPFELMSHPELVLAEGREVPVKL
ncbi:MAG: amidohydrolase [Candidatus Hydrothermota bacterium]|nr:MAG: amidohydrolase [Candidatus Hydrothermae bacterium]